MASSQAGTAAKVANLSQCSDISTQALLYGDDDICPLSSSSKCDPCCAEKDPTTEVWEGAIFINKLPNTKQLQQDSNKRTDKCYYLLGTNSKNYGNIIL